MDDIAAEVRETTSRRIAAMHASYLATLACATTPEQAAAVAHGARLAADDTFRAPPHPYPGLRSFSPSEGSVFYGRERSVDDVRERLASEHVVFVLGGSGSGKSSVVRAGLMPRLNSTKDIRGRSGNWYAVDFRPRRRPLEELAEALASLVARHFADQPSDVLDAGVSAEECEDAVNAQRYDAILTRLQASFDLAGSASSQGRENRAALQAAALFRFVDLELDRRDRMATRGLRSGPPNLLLVIDQFEEVFRPEVMDDPLSGGASLLDLLICACTLLERGRENSETKSRTYIAVTMRSEELHRCTEHPALTVQVGADTVCRSVADIVNRSCYLLDLLDPDQDRADLREAIVQPARRVLRDWGVPLAQGAADAPFADGMVDWLIDGARCLQQGIEHRPDLLPLLQHALQAIWHEAVQDSAKNQFAQFSILQKHLPVPRTSVGEADERGTAGGADLSGCLDASAASVYGRALDSFARAVGEASNAGPLTRREAIVSASAGREAVKASFRALARRDDRGNWARRFADRHQVLVSLRENAALKDFNAEAVGRGLRAAMERFVERGYLSAKGDVYDISHEALIRNWSRYQEWLRDPDEIAQAISRAVADVEPEHPGVADPSSPVGDAYLRDVLPPVLCDRLDQVFKDRILPEAWAVEQIAGLIRRPPVWKRWQVLLTKDATGPGGGREYELAAAILAKLREAVARARRSRASQKRKRRVLSGLAVAASTLATFAVAAVFATQSYARFDRTVTFAERDPSPGFRLRIRLLLEAVENASGFWSPLLDGGWAEAKLRDVLARAPVFGQTARAVGVGEGGATLALLLPDNTLIVRNERGVVGGSLRYVWPPPGANLEAAVGEYRQSPFFELPVVGLLSGLSGEPSAAVYENGFLSYWQGNEQRHFDLRPLFPADFGAGTNFRQAEIANGVLRISIAVFRDGSFENRMLSFEVYGNRDALAVQVRRAESALATTAGRFAPTVASGCNLYAFVDTEAKGGTRNYVVRGGRIGDLPLARGELSTQVPAPTEPAFPPSLAFTADCGMLVVRDRADRVNAFPVSSDGEALRIGPPRSFDVQEEARGVLEGFWRTRPALAAAAIENGGMRFAWLTRDGVVVTEASGAALGERAVLLRGWPRLFTGPDMGFSLQFSLRGGQLTLTQANWADRRASMRARVWDLSEDRLRRLHSLRGGQQFHAPACEAASVETGEASLTDDERQLWFGRDYKIRATCPAP